MAKRPLPVLWNLLSLMLHLTGQMLIECARWLATCSECKRPRYYGPSCR